MMTMMWVRLSITGRALQERVREGSDRGSGSVDTAIVVGLVAAAALVLAGLMTDAIRSFGDEIPKGG